MYFSKIEIIGFKSFADKTVIPFDHNIIGIVGPNGCGKSNVADAIRWVLGEQSAKTLRGTSMQDVIFNGTQNRKSLSYCEVSLYFDNSDKLFPSEEFTEVVLTRKLYRSGESEYVINKRPARLKDIVNLLHDCGVSKEGYSIIGQGKVAEIISSKPEDRRAIFEEAVGIAKTKNERQETQRKLERTKQNIIRYSDICADLERQLGPLARQAETAKQFLSLTEEQKFHEVNAYLYKFENASDMKQKINLRIKGVDEQLALRANELDSAEKTYTDSFNQIGMADSNIKKLHEEILERTVGMEKKAGFVNVFAEKISNLQSDIVRVKEENDKYSARIQELADNIRTKRELSAAKKFDLEKLEEEIKWINGELSKITALINQGEQEQQANTSLMIESLENLSDIKSNISSLSTEKNVISSQQLDVVNKVDVLHRKLELLQEERAKYSDLFSKLNRDIASLKEEIEATENGIKVTNEKIATYNSQLFKLGGKLNQLEISERFYRGVRDSFDGFNEAVKKLMVESKTNKDLASKIKGVVASIIHTDQKYEQAIQYAIGNAVQFIVTENENDTNYLINYLNRNGWGRATFLPVSAAKMRYDSEEVIEAKRMSGAIGLATDLVTYDKYFDVIVSSILGNTLICDTKENAVSIARRYRYAFKIVTLEGEVFSPSGSITGGSKRQGSNLMSIDNKLNDYVKDIEETKNEINALTTKKVQSEKVGGDLVDELNAFNADLQSKKEESVALKEKININEGLLTDTEAEVDSYRDVLKQINTRLSEINREQVSIEEGSQIIAEKKQNASLDAEKNRSVYDELKSKRDELILKNTDSQTEMVSTRNEITTLSEEIERHSADITDYRGRIRDNENIITNDEKNIERLKIEAEKVALSSSEQKEINELRAKLAEFEEQKDTLNQLMMQSDLNKKVAQGEIAKLTETKMNEEFALEKVDIDLQNAAEKLWEDYQLNYEGCIALKDDNYDIVSSAQEINRIKRKINSLGSINANAINDYNELNEVYQDRILQKQDLETAAQNIQSSIDLLTDEMTKKFSDGFEVIRVNFKKVFKELFGGGTADLVLDYTNVEDPLDAGVEIEAQPPGKKLTKISLLSGGEMSLTAIAILFAILKLRPMPFCVLDEIEAALDDANVERFARYLKNFSEETQFIVITHKKVTMELSDALFGVTMEEKGVSKIVSVNLTDLEDGSVD